MKKEIVCFGGGSAMSKTTLIGLKKYPVKLFAVSSMLDSGGSSAQFRVDFKTLPAGDIRRHLIALSDAPSWKKELFALRIGREIFDGGHKGHSFGNIFVSGLEHIFQDFEKAMEISHEFLEVKDHKAFPATTEQSHIYAILENGEVIFGEDEIDIPQRHDPELKIKKLFLTKKVKAYSPVVDVISKADLIVIGPGDLYSSLLPCFLPDRIAEALQKTKAKKVFVCNTMTKHGETNNFSVLDFSNKIEEYMDCCLDFVIYNKEISSKERIDKHKENALGILESVRIDKELDDKKFIGSNILIKDGPIFHDPDVLAKLIMSL
ncbi:MAG: YvcK family protein [Candidatus Pacebacteria bacterium]|nr:YvcK family protein [Candidatus Paceibacterota bacterium]